MAGKRREVLKREKPIKDTELTRGEDGNLDYMGNRWAMKVDTQIYSETRD